MLLVPVLYSYTNNISHQYLRKVIPSSLKMQSFIYLLVFDLKVPTVPLQIFLNMYDKRVT